jgi:hypothetical protein
MKPQQIAELIVGIAKSQIALINAIEAALPGFMMKHAIPVLQTAAHVSKPDLQPTLTDLPSRVLLQTLGSLPPERRKKFEEWLHLEVGRLLG